MPRRKTVNLLATVALCILGESLAAEAQTSNPGSLGEANAAANKTLDDYLSAADTCAQREAAYQAALEASALLKRGRKAGDPVFDKAEAERVRTWNEAQAARTARDKAKKALENALVHQNNTVEIVERTLNAAAGIRPRLADLRKAEEELQSAQNRLENAETQVAHARQDRERQDNLLASANKRKDAVDMAVANAAREEAVVRERDSLQALATARTGMKTAQQNHHKAQVELQSALDNLRNLLDTVGIKTSHFLLQGSPSPVRQVGFLTRRLKRGYVQSGLEGAQAGEFLAGRTELPATPLGDDSGLSLEAPPEVAPAMPLALPGGVSPYDPIVDGLPLARLPVYIDGLDPPLAPVPSRPAECQWREIALDDPASSWKLDRPNTVIELVQNTRDSKMAADGHGSLPAGIAMPNLKTRSFIFDCPAHFPVMRFHNRAKSYENEGLLIFQGMVLRIAADGSYELEFSAVGVAIPVTLRLQLSLHIGKTCYKLSLPPFLLDPRGDGRINSDANNWHVVHRGTCSFLRFAIWQAMDGLERDGVARFGSGVTPFYPAGE